MADQNAMGITRVSRPGAGADYWCGGRRLRLLLTGEETGGRLALVLATERRGAEPPRHSHGREDEVIYVLAGTLTYYVAGAAHPAPAGTALFLPRGVEHWFVVGSPEATVLRLFIPAGLDDAIREVGEPAGGDSRPPSAGGLDIERLVSVAARYGCEITGPPPDDDRPTTREATTGTNERLGGKREPTNEE